MGHTSWRQHALCGLLMTSILLISMFMSRSFETWPGNLRATALELSLPTLLIVGPLASMWAALSASAPGRFKFAAFEAQSARGPVSLSWSRWWPITLTTVLSYSLALAIVHLYSAQTAYAHSFWPSFALPPVFTLAVATAFGTLVGSLMRNKFSTPVAGVGYLVGLFALAQIGQLSRLAGVSGQYVDSVNVEPSSISSFLAATFWVLAAGSFIALSTMRDRLVRRHRASLGLTALLTTMALVVGGLCLATWSDKQSRSGTPAHVACENSGQVSVCVWPEYAHRMPEYLDLASKARETPGGKHLVPQHLAQTGIQSPRGPANFNLTSSDISRDQALNKMISDRRGGGAPMDCITDFDGYVQSKAWFVNEVAGQYGSSLAVSQDVIQQFDALPDADKEERLKTFAEELAQCS